MSMNGQATGPLSGLGVVFDLDGTLIDSAPAIMAVGDRLLAEQGLTPLTLPEARGYIGRGAAMFVRQALAARGVEDPETLARATARFETLYAEADPRDNRPMTGVDAVLAQLARDGAALGLCTNKPGAPTRTILRAFGWSDVFSAVVTGDTLPAKKPDPAPLIEAGRRLGRERVVYVGDSEVDAETASRAGMPFLLFTEGYLHVPVDAIACRARFARWSHAPGLIALASAPARLEG